LRTPPIDIGAAAVTVRALQHERSRSFLAEAEGDNAGSGTMPPELAIVNELEPSTPRVELESSVMVPV